MVTRDKVNPSNLVAVLGYAYDLGIMTHSTILVQKSLR